MDKNTEPEGASSEVENMEANESQIHPELESSKTVAENQKNPSSNLHGHPKKVMFAAITMVVILFGAGTYFVLTKNKTPLASNQTQSTPSTAKSTSPKTPTVLEQQLAKFTKPTTGEVWYSTPKNLPLQGYLNPSQYTEDPTTIQYFEVGTHGKNTIIMLSNSEGLGTDNELFEKTPEGKVSFILHPNGNSDYTSKYDTPTSSYDINESETVKSSIQIDKTTHYDSFSMPTEFDLGKGETALPPTYNSIGDSPNHSAGSTLNIKDIVMKKYGGSYISQRVRSYTDTGLSAISYVLTTPLGTEITLQYLPLAQDFKGYKWDSGNDVTGAFGPIVRGCGAGIAVSRDDNTTDADFVKSGTSPSGQAIFNFKDTSNETVQKAWKETKDYYSDQTDAASKAKANISIEDFIKNHGIFAYKSPNNGWLVYTSDAYAPIGGCAKPVVYLYPTMPEKVSVKVGARVKVSDPLYDPATGWHVFAWPNGNLNVSGKIYGSLYWEGQGIGLYPGITSGTVVKRADVVSTIRKQLAEQGLNQKETDDFVAYWSDKIPSEPYVRLSWLSTAEMNELAPLYISPKPNTMLRVFLDMSGFDKPFNMPAQIFSSPMRNGFTVVEWGGLAQGKLY